MPIPPERLLRKTLLSELASIGGSAKPAEMYERVAACFPELTADDLAEELESGHKIFNNRVQWARQRLVAEGLIDSSVRAVWTLTDEGQQAAADGYESEATGPQTYILTWNPARWTWEGLPQLVAKTQSGEPVTERWSTGVTKRIQPGDQMFLLRLGEEPRGVIGHGSAVTGVYEEPHWDSNRAAAGGQARYVDVEFDYLLDPARSPPLAPSDLTDARLNQVNWSPQASGVRLDDDAAEALAEAWRRHIGPATGARALTTPSSTPEKQRASLIGLLEEHDVNLRRELKQMLQSIEPHQFEALCGRLLRAMGFRNVEVTARSGDGGVDGHGQLKLGIVSVRAAFQCKRWIRPVGRPEIDAVRGATQGKFDQAIFMTTSSFTDGARADAIRTGCIPVVLLDGNAIVERMIEHSIGVTTRPLVVPRVDESFFAEHLGSKAEED